MTTDQDFERQVRGILRDTLDRELGPDPVWADSPAARRAADQERKARRRWPLRLLAVAAVMGAVGGGAMLAGALAERPDTSGVAENGWIALTVSDSDPSGAADEDIWLVALDKGARRVIGTDSDNLRQLCPAFSPDGRSLAYGRVEGHSTEFDANSVTAPAAYRNAALVVADVRDDGSADDRLTIDVGDGLPPPCPVWSPDGVQVAFGVPRTSPVNPTTSGAGSEVWVVRPGDAKVTVLPDLLATGLAWSPDGTQLGIATQRERSVSGEVLDSRIRLYEPASGAMRPLDGTAGAGQLTWSPDGQLIAYMTGDSEHELRAIDVQTGRQEVLAAPFIAIHGIGPVWSPDGEAIVYQRSVGRENHEVVLVMPGDRSDDSVGPREVVIPSFQQTAEGSGHLFPYRVTWSPDGKYLLYVAWTTDWTEAGTVAPLDGVEAGVIDPIVVAVPTDPALPAVVLSQRGDLVVNDGYPDTLHVPIQTWGRLPARD
jgi:Tol biopolymer transport system component